MRKAILWGIVILAIYAGLTFVKITQMPQPEMITQPEPTVTPSFEISAVQSTRDYSTGSQTHRTVYIILDTKTGVEYIGVNGIGITELQTKRVGTVTVQVEE